jgi:hypothetical protein
MCILRCAVAAHFLPRSSAVYEKVEDATIELHWQGQFRSPDFSPNASSLLACIYFLVAGRIALE